MNLFSKLTIVIPTVGEETLINVVRKINSGHKIPKKIIISIYKKKLAKLPREIYKFSNVKILATVKMGQVHQRCLAFSKVNTEFVMQLDADCFIDSKSIEKLLLFISKKKNISVAPVFLNIINNKPIHNYIDRNFLLDSLKNLILGFPLFQSKMGKISKSGTNFGVDSRCMKNNFIIADWTPGGCVMHRNKKFLINEYFPFKGKAYCEDLINSVIFKKNKIKIYCIKNSIVKTSSPTFPTDKKNFHKFMKAYDYFIKISELGGFRTLLIKLIYNFRFYYANWNFRQ
jgi:hypothetical protein